MCVCSFFLLAAPLSRTWDPGSRDAFPALILIHTLIGPFRSREQIDDISYANESRDPLKQYPYCLSRALIGYSPRRPFILLKLPSSFSGFKSQTFPHESSYDGVSGTDNDEQSLKNLSKCLSSLAARSVLLISKRQ